MDRSVCLLENPHFVCSLFVALPLTLPASKPLRVYPKSCFIDSSTADETGLVLRPSQWLVNRCVTCLRLQVNDRPTLVQDPPAGHASVLWWKSDVLGSEG